LNEYADASIDRIGKQAERLGFAIGNAPTFMAIDYDTYEKLHMWCIDTAIAIDAMETDPDFTEEQKHMARLEIRDNFRDILMEVIPPIGKEWIDLGKPNTSEEWMRRKYGTD
jgi:hypothetical protein